MATPSFGIPFSVFGTPQRGPALGPTKVDVSTAQIFTIDIRGGAGALLLQQLLGDNTPAGNQPYSLNADLSSPVTGTFTFLGGERLYCAATSALIQLSGTITAGSVTFDYTPWQVAPPGSAPPATVNGAPVGPLNALPVTIPDTVLLASDPSGAPIGATNGLPVNIVGGAGSISAGTATTAAAPSLGAGGSGILGWLSFIWYLLNGWVGTAGSASTSVLTVQGIASGTPVTGDQAPITVSDTGTVAGSATSAVFPTISAKWARFKALPAATGNNYIRASTSAVTVPTNATTVGAGFVLGPGDDTGWFVVKGGNLNNYHYIGDNGNNPIMYWYTN